MSRRFVLAYALLVLLAAGAFAAALVAYRSGPPAPVAPAAVRVVQRFMAALSAGDTSAACRIYSDLPACAHRGPATVQRYRIFPAEYTLDGVAVPVTIDGANAEIDLQRNARGVYRITTIVAAPAAALPSPELAA